MPLSVSQSTQITRFAVAFEGGLIILALGIGWLLGRSPWPDAPTSRAALPAFAVHLGIGLLATIPMIAGLFWLDRCDWQPIARLRNLVHTQIVPLFRNASILHLAVISAAAGVGEEMLFRGLLQSVIAEQFAAPMGVWIGLILAATAFGICHWLTPAYAFLAALMGCYFGLLFIATGSLTVPIVAHGLYDFVALLYMTRGEVNST